MNEQILRPKYYLSKFGSIRAPVTAETLTIDFEKVVTLNMTSYARIQRMNMTLVYSAIQIHVKLLISIGTSTYLSMLR